ncbi:hypothetical protein ACHAXM_002111 [Skeletonema potamos]
MVALPDPSPRLGKLNQVLRQRLDNHMNVWRFSPLKCSTNGVRQNTCGVVFLWRKLFIKPAPISSDLYSKLS